MVERITRVKEEVMGVVSLMGSLYLFLSLFSHSLRDPVLFFRTTEPPEPVRNLGGIVGSQLSGWLIILLGLAAFIIPVLIVAFGMKRLLGREGHKVYLLGGILCIISTSILLSLVSETFAIGLEKYPDGIGGLAGRAISYLFIQLVSLPGAYIFSLSAFLSSVVLISPVSVTSIAVKRKTQKAERREFREEPNPEEQEILITEPRWFLQLNRLTNQCR